MVPATNKTIIHDPYKDVPKDKIASIVQIILRDVIRIQRKDKAGIVKPVCPDGFLSKLSQAEYDLIWLQAIQEEELEHQNR